jgi:hypothetical protein
VFILVLQLLFSAAAVKGCAAAGVLDAEPLRWRLVRPFLLIVGGFLGTLYANIKVLVYSNVETFITFRCALRGLCVRACVCVCVTRVVCGVSFCAAQRLRVVPPLRVAPGTNHNTNHRPRTHTPGPARRSC